jgi:hypothetical protein
MKNKILQMNRNQLIDFLIKNETHFTRIVPHENLQRFFNNNPDFHTTEKLRRYALSI